MLLTAKKLDDWKRQIERDSTENTKLNVVSLGIVP